MRTSEVLIELELEESSLLITMGAQGEVIKTLFLNLTIEDFSELA